ncbi:dienelactone hydrolase family protein [Shimazuella sp. AN120528]|uniref:alpha/beta hydrolase family protein n=1 Tax=Shimazuella soli TaxID=1892854 RepID=UPI001F0E2596|nr:dienelactone hydrolase family protein [Shimazuella soli]MCH5584421.1 dienelactone hydrolase family protein [Shimazuella soli]
MRIFEMILILVNLISLFLSFKKQSKVVWLLVTGVNLSVFFFHVVFEGVRYQMAFSYLFVILLVAYTLIKTNKRFFEARFPKVLKIIVISLSLIFLAATSYLAYALPVFTLPKPTGSYNVGIKYIRLVDDKRKDPFLNKSTQKRELMTKVYYPAKKDDSKAFDPYFHHSTQLIKALTDNYHLPEIAFDQLKLVQTNSKEDLQLSDKQKSYPIILFSHGAGTTMEVETSQCEDLASHGYIVVAIDHTYLSAGSVFPDKFISPKEITTQFNMGDITTIFSQIMADDDKFVIKKLGEMNEGKMNSNFKGKLNLNKIGVIGHSLGGSAAYNLAINDSRVKAAINLDGTVFTTPKNFKHMAPFLMIANDKVQVQTIENKTTMMPKFESLSNEDKKIMLSSYGSKEAYDKAYEKMQQEIIGLNKVLKASGNLFTIIGSDHMKFTDIGLWIGDSYLRDLINITGKTDPAKCLEITKAVTLAFFDQHLKGKTTDSLDLLVKKDPLLKKVDLK